MARAPLSLRARALRLLGMREHSRAELQRKLAPHELEPGELALVLDDLEAKGLISQDRVAASVLHQRAPKLGLLRIKQELMRKGLDAQVVAQTLADLQASEVSRARAVWWKKFGEQPASGPERARQMRFLLSRGFSTQTIAQVLGKGAHEPDPDESIASDED